MHVSWYRFSRLKKKKRILVNWVNQILNDSEFNWKAQDTILPEHCFLSPYRLKWRGGVVQPGTWIRKNVSKMSSRIREGLGDCIIHRIWRGKKESRLIESLLEYNPDVGGGDKVSPISYHSSARVFA